MIYQIRQKVFSFGDNFSIKDQMGNDCFIVKGKVFSFGNKLHLLDMSERELFYIEQKLFKFLPQYTIYGSGQPVARIKKEFTFFRQSFNIESVYGNYTMEGNVFAHDFQILKNGMQVAQISKKWFSFSDTYGVEIADSEDQGFLLAMVIVIDQVLHKNNGD